MTVLIFKEYASKCLCKHLYCTDAGKKRNEMYLEVR